MVVRLRGVRGLQARRNDVLFAPAARSHPAAPHTLVFWGGDVQDYPEVMQAHRNNREYLKWNLELTARRLSHSFPAHHIVVVRPSRIEYKSYSCYDNFVPSNKAGVPDHVPTHGAIPHLQKLLQEASRRIKAIPEEKLLTVLDAAALQEDDDVEDSPQTELSEESDLNGSAEASPSGTDEPGTGSSKLWWRRGLALHSAPLRLLGFSKGCVVLNQLLHELHHSAHTRDRLTLNIEAMYWLDGGHSGGRDTWLTSRCLLETLKGLDIDIFVHVSPYQVQDATRPWIGQEERTFTSILKQLGAKIHRYMHDGGGAPPSLHMHFGVLDAFGRTQLAGASSPGCHSSHGSPGSPDTDVH